MKKKSYFNCNECGYRSAKWLGKCPSCDSWDTFQEVIEDNNKNHFNKAKSNTITTTNILKISDINTENNFRIKTNINELDRVLGGGVVPGSLILVGGDPGIGKSTLLLQMSSSLIENNPLYITGEESLNQIKLRANRLGNISPDLNILCETNIENINSAILNSDAKIIILDSIQSVYSERSDSTPGSILQVRECASLMMQTAKQTGKSIFLIGHVTKDGMIAGPKILEHLVDTVLQFEGDKTYSYRILRALKNRYGSTNEIGIFEMQDKGMKEVNNPSELFLAQRHSQEPGIAISATIEGSRTILLEVQALVTPSGYGIPQRVSNGFDQRRLQMIISVLEKRLGLPFRNNDIFINIAGGLYINDPAVDLAIAMAIISSLKDYPINNNTVFIGEIGLTGEIRQVSQIEQRINESIKLGFKQIYLSNNPFEESGKNKNNIKVIHRISLALTDIFI